MANNAFQELINELILINNERMNATIDQAHTQTGVETRGFITQESTSNLSEDIKWIKGRGYASDNKKSKMLNEVKQHYTQASGLYSESIKEKIRVVREDVKLTEEEKNKQVVLLENERTAFEKKLEDTLKRAEAEIKALPTVKNNLDTLPATRGSYRASVAQKAAKINAEIAEKLKAVKESEFKTEEELRKWAEKQMDEMYSGVLLSPVKTVEELLKSNPPKAPKPMAKIPSQPKRTAEISPDDKAIRDAFQQHYKRNKGIDRKEWMKSNFSYDTETTKIQNGKANAATLAFARYIEQENGQMVAEAKSFFLQYNSKSKNFDDNSKTVKVILDALNATTDNDKKKLLESAMQMRKKLGLQQSGQVSEGELKKIWDGKIKDSLVTPEELFKVVDQWGINGSNLWGFNNAGFDSKVLKNWINQYDGQGGKASEELRKIFEASEKNDLMVMAKKAAKLQKGMGGLRKGSSFLMGNSKVANSQIGGIINLQGFVSILTGSSSSGAHDESDDAINTLRLAEQASTTNFFQQFFGALEQSIRNRLGGKKVQRDEKGYFSDEYKDAVYDSAYALRDIFNATPQLEGTGKVDTRVPNQQVTQKFARLGKDVRNLASSEFSVDRLKEKIVSEYAARGVGVKFDGNKVGFYSLEKYKDPKQATWDKMATVEMAELDDSGSLRRGRQSVANLTYLDYLFSGKGNHPRAAIYSGLEAQYQHLLNVAGYQKDESGKFVDSAIVSAIKNGDLDRASNIAGIGVSSVLKGSPTGTASSVLNEIDGMMSGYKNPEQLILNSGLFSTMHLAERVLRFHAEQVQEIYNNNPNSKGKIIQFNPNEISDSEYKAITKAYAMIAGGFTNEEYFTGADPLTKALVTNKQLFGDFQKMVETFVAQGMVPDLASLKEEAFGSSLLASSGARNVLPLNIYDDQGSRASHQIFKYAERVNAPTMSRPMLFSSLIGMDNGVDYGKRELSQYLGAATSDAKLAKALQKLDPNIKDTIVSVDEGGVIMSKSMAKELSGYRRQQFKAYDDEVNAAFIRDVLKIDPKSLANLKEGDAPIEFNKTLEKDAVFANNQELAKGDVILGLERVGESLQLLVKRFEQVETGTKMLTEGGGRYTARVVDDDYYKSLTKALGVEGAQFLYEEKGYEERHMMPRLRGRLSYMMGEAVNQGMKPEELLKTMRDNLQLAKGMYLDKNGRIYDTAFLDDKTNRYKYKDERGRIQDLFDNKVGAELEDAMRKAFVEVSADSDFSKFGMALQSILPNFNYAATSHLTSQFINMTDEVPYYDTMGSGNIDSLDKQGRVKVADRERRAFERVISSVQNSMNRGVIGSAIEEGLSLYAKDQTRQFTQQGATAQKANQTIEQIHRAIDARRVQGYAAHQYGDALTLVARDVKKDANGNDVDNELDIRSLSTSFKIDEGKTALTPEQYRNTIMAVAREKAEKFGGNIVLDYGGQQYLLADYAPIETREGYFPSVTDRANNKLFSALLNPAHDSNELEKVLQQVLGDMGRPKGSDYWKIANDKDSQIFKDANEVRVGNASYSKAVGRNTAYTSNNLDDVNTVYMNPEKLKDLMRSAKGASVDELKKNIQNLRYMAKASGSKSFDSEQDLSGVKRAKSLRNIEESIIAKIVREVGSGQYNLLGQAHRYPSTSGLDIRHTKIGIDNQLSRDAVSLSAGLSATINADYDGDKVWQRLSFLNSDYNNFEEFQKAYSAASELTEMDRKIAAHMESWVKANNDKSLRQKNESEADYIARQNKEIDDYVKRMASPEQNKLASIFAKSNKEYVGKFSNISTNVRTFMQDAKMDESGAGGRQSGLSVILRAYLESLEQDAISAKKVFKRLSGKDGERGTAAIDELQDLYNYIGKGEFTKAVEHSQKLNLGFEKSRQLEFAKAYLMNYSPDLYEKEFKGVLEEKDDEKRAAAIANLVKEGWNNLVNVATAGGGGNIEDALYLTQDRKAVISKAAVNLSNHRVLSPREQEAVIKAQQEASEEQRKRTQQAVEEAKKARDSATFTSGTFSNQDGANYDIHHMRKGWIPDETAKDGQRHFEDVLGKNNEVIRSILSVTGLFSKEQTYQSFADKQRAEIAAAKGTYAHKVSELLGKTGFASVDELFGTEYEKELSDALNALKRTEGLDVSEELEKQLNLRAALASKTARSLGFFDQGNGVQTFQEAILGGKFSNADQALAGQADLLRISETEGITVGDYKFSTDNSPATVAKRIAQASAYLYLEEEALKSELSGLKEKQSAGTATDADIARIASIENTLQAAANGGRKVQVIRNYVDKSGRIFTEVIESEALSAQAMAEMLNDAQISAQLKAKIQQLQALINKGTATEEQVKDYHQLLAQLASTNAFSSADVTSKVGDSFTVTTKDEYGQVVKQQSYEEQQKQVKKDAKHYLNNYQQQQRVQEKIQLTQQGMQGKTGEELASQQAYLRALQEQLMVLQQQAPIIQAMTDDKGNAVFDEEGNRLYTINGEVASNQQILELKKKQAVLDAQHASRQAKITASQKQEVGLLGKIVGGLKNRMTMFIDYSLAYQIIGKVRQAITTLINTTRQLDGAMVNIQIATGNTKKETRELMLSYVDLANELGRTTQSVAEASNDWLRAGYEGQQAAELTRASMILSTLGMIEANQATTYLISTLKGWKLSASEVIGVVDKLTAVDMAAAISAGDLALAMSRANNSARLAGSDMDRFIGYVTTVADVTQKSAESVGESFKTIYSRFGNVKANKFAATVDDQNSSDYNADNFENLNDIETVLSRVGIKLRENASTWRDIDTVIEDIANNWKTWDKTTQNAVATVVAGTRQRENVITLFENWDSVAKFSDIASDAYGTATKKMEAYTTSVEASKQRMTVAIEEWALNLNQGDLLRKFYDSLTYIIENLHTFAIVLSGFAVLTNFDKMATFAGASFGKMATKTSVVSNIFSGFQNNGFKGGLKAGKEAFIAPLETARINRQVVQYGATLDKYSATLNEQQLLTVKNMQADLLMLNTKDRKLVAETMSGNLIVQEIQTNMASMSQETQQTIASGLLANCKSEYRKKILRAIVADEKETLSTEELASAEKVFARELYRQSQKGVLRTVGQNIGGSTSPEQTAVGSAIIGVGSMAGSIIGGKVASQVLSDAEPTLQILGTVGGSMLGQYALKALASAAAGVKTGSLAGPWGIVAGIVVGAVYSAFKSSQEKAIKEAQEEFKELEQRYSKMRTTQSDAEKLDKLATGVDKLGRNISLTEEEYEDFLELNNSLADIYPELVVRIDQAGNHFLGLGDQIGNVSEKVKELIDYQEILIDAKMFEETGGFLGMGTITTAEDLFNKTQKLGSNAVVDVFGDNTVGWADKLLVSNWEDKIVNGDDNLWDRIFLNNTMTNIGARIAERAGVSEQEAINAKNILKRNDFDKLPTLQKNEALLVQQKIQGAFNSMFAEIINRRKAVTTELAGVMDMAVRNKYRDEFNGMSDEESYYWQQIRGNISAFDKNGYDISHEDFFNNTQTVFSKYNNVFMKNPHGKSLLKTASKSYEDYNTINDYSKDRQKLMAHLNRVFSGGGFDESEMAIILGLKFDVKDGELIDTTDIVSQFDQQGISKFSQQGDEISQFKLQKLKPEDAQKALELIKSGAIETNGSMSALVDLLYADRDMPTTLEGATQYASKRLKDYDELLNRVKSDKEDGSLDMFSDVDNIDVEFSKYPTTIREALKSAKEEAESGNADIDRVFSTLENNINGHRVDILKGVAEVALSDVFGDDVLGNIEGIIDTFDELKTVLESIGNAYSRLGDAQKEYNKYGRLSTQTVAELLASNSNYIKVLKYEEGAFHLTKDAQKIMAAEQASATIVSLKAAQAAIKVTQATKEEELAIIDETLTQDENEQETVANIEATKVWTRATGILVGFLRGLGASMKALVNGENMGDAFDSAFAEQKALTDSEVNKLTWEQEYQGLTKEELETRKTQVQQEINDLQSEYDVYEGIISDFQKAINTGDYEFLGEDFGLDLDFEEAMTELERLEAVLGNINKEWEAMQVYSKELGKELKPTEYFDKMRSNLTAQETLLKNQLAKGGLEERERFEAEGKLQEVQVKLANLDDEEIEDKIKIAQLEGASLATMKDLQTELLKASDTYEEKLQYQKDYNQLLEDELQLVKTRGDLIDEETYAREQFAKNGGSLSDSFYYDDQKAQIKAERKAIEDILANDINPENGAKLTDEEKLKYQKELLDLDNKEANIEDERLEKMLEEVEAQNASLDIRKDLQKQLIAEADNQNELLERQQKYNDLLKEEQELRESIASALNDEYLAMRAFQSGDGTSFYDMREKALKDAEESINKRLIQDKIAKGEIVPIKAPESGNSQAGLSVGTYVDTGDGHILEIVGVGENAFGSLEAGQALGYNYNPNSGYWSYKTDFIPNAKKLSDPEYLDLIQDQQNNYVDQQNLDDQRIQHQINLLKGQKADLSAVTAQYKQLIETADTEEEFYDYYQQYLDAFIAEFDDRISNIQRKIDNLEKARPQEWKSTINKNGLIIESAESKINSYYKKMDVYYQNQLSAAKQALKYSSELTEDEIEHLVDTANDAIKAIHDNAIAQAEDLKNYQESIYSALTNEVQRYIDDLEKQKEVVEETYNKELEKLQDKEDAIARTNKLIELQNNLLNAQKEKERVYRAGIGWTYESNREKVRTAENELNNFYRQDNIDNLNNAKDAELKVLDDRIKNWQNYLEMLNEKYKEYEILEEKRLLKELLNVETDAEIKAAIVADMTNFTTEIGLNYSTFIANQSAFYLSYNSTFSSFLSDYSTNLATLASLKSKELSLLNSNNYSSVNLSSAVKSSGSKKSSSASTVNAQKAGMSAGDQAALKAAGDAWGVAYAKGDEKGMVAAHATAEKIRGQYGYSGGEDGSQYIPKYSSGILNGPVTYTGLAMLHGSPSEPEYVLNNDQAYGLLRYMATKKIPDFESNNNNKNSGIQYIVEGDIVLEGVDNPQEFWGEVTKAMGNRWNVTKNR